MFSNDSRALCKAKTDKLAQSFSGPYMVTSNATSTKLVCLYSYLHELDKTLRDEYKTSVPGITPFLNIDFPLSSKAFILPSACRSTPVVGSSLMAEENPAK